MTLYPLAYEGGKIPQVNITLMPGLVTSYEQGHRWKQAPIGQELERILEDKGVKVITWIWQAGGVAAKPRRCWCRKTSRAPRSAAAASTWT